MKTVDEGIAGARKALRQTTEAHLMKPWRLLVAGKVVSEQPRHVMLRDSINHLAHHRGQLTVYSAPERRPGTGDLRAVSRRSAFQLIHVSFLTRAAPGRMLTAVLFRRGGVVEKPPD